MGAVHIGNTNAKAHIFSVQYGISENVRQLADWLAVNAIALSTRTAEFPLLFQLSRGYFFAFSHFRESWNASLLSSVGSRALIFLPHSAASFGARIRPRHCVRARSFVHGWTRSTSEPSLQASQSLREGLPRHRNWASRFWSLHSGIP
jgi:hypothetical protein